MPRKSAPAQAAHIDAHPQEKRAASCAPSPSSAHAQREHWARVRLPARILENPGLPLGGKLGKVDGLKSILSIGSKNPEL